MIRKFADLEMQNKEDEKKIIFVVCGMLCIDQFVFLANAIGNYFVGRMIWDTLFIYLIMSIIILQAINPIIRRFKFSTFILSMFILFVWLISLVLYSQNQAMSFYGMSGRLLYSVVVGYFFSVSIEDFNMFEKYLLKTISIISVIMIISFLIYNFVLKIKWDTNIMGFSYMLLPAAIGELYKFFKNIKLINLILGLADIVIMLFFGSRGPFLSIIIFIILYLIANRKNRNKYFAFSSSIIYLICLTIYFNLHNILLFLNDIAVRNSIRGKIIDGLLNNTISDDNGRAIIYYSAVNLIKDNPFFGIGMFGDYNYIGIYSHNLIIELLVDFGVIFGILIILLIFYIILRAFFSRDITKSSIVSYFIGIGLVKLFVSDSLWTFPFFFILLGLCISIVTMKENQKL